MSKCHKAVVTVGPRRPLELRDVPTPIPSGNEILVHVLWLASTPLNLHQADGGLLVTPPQILGGAIAGRIVAVGPEVTNFAIGDEVFGFTWRSEEERAHQEYVVAPTNLFGKIPPGFKMDDVATIPDSFVTAFQCSLNDLGLELPWPKPEGWAPKHETDAILVWGGSSSVGFFELQILRYYGFKNVIATGSKKHHELLRSLGATVVVDYRDDDVLQQIRAAAGGDVAFVIDCIGSLQGSVKPISQIVGQNSIVAIMLPVIVKDASDIEEPIYEMDVTKDTTWGVGVVAKGVRTHFYLNNEFLANHLQPEIMPAMLTSGAIKPTRTLIVEAPTLLERAEKSLDLLRERVPSAERLVWRVSE